MEGNVEKKDEQEAVVKTEKEITGNPEDQKIEVEKKVEVAPAEEKPAEADDLPDEEDHSALLALINEIDTSNGGAGGISDVQPQIITAVKVLADKLAAAVATLKDPIINDIIMDMIEQREDGAEPDAMLAIARNVPIDELEGIEGEGNYDSLQDATKQRIADRDADVNGKNDLLDKIDKSMANLETYASENGLDEDRKNRLWDTVRQMIDVFADGEVSVNEYAIFDKGANYDEDIESIKSQVPEEPTKEVLPDASNFKKSAPSQTKQNAPVNSIETLGATMGGEQQWTDVGKRKRKA